MSVIAGCLALTDAKVLGLIPFSATAFKGSHLTPSKYNPTVSAGDFLLEGEDSQSVTYVPSRAETLHAVLSGQIDHNLGLKYAVSRSLSLDTPNQNLKLKDIVLSQLGENIPGSYSLVLSTSSRSGRSSRMVLVNRHRTLYLLGVAIGSSLYLVWSNQPDMETDISRAHPEALYYRYLPQTNSLCVVQTLFLVHRIRRWTKDGLEHLKMFAAIERSLSNSTERLLLL